MLAVVRQVAENARIEQASREILALLSTFNKEWRKYTEQMEKMGRSLASAVDHYERLTTTRSRKLEKQLDRIEDLRTQREIALPDEEPAALPPNAD